MYDSTFETMKKKKKKIAVVEPTKIRICKISDFLHVLVNKVTFRCSVFNTSGKKTRFHKMCIYHDGIKPGIDYNTLWGKTGRTPMIIFKKNI